MVVPGVTASDTKAYRIEAMRVYLENNIGDELFIAAHKHLVNLPIDDDDSAS